MAASTKGFHEGHPNDPEVVSHQMRLSAVKMSQAEREGLLAVIDRELARLDQRRDEPDGGSAPDDASPSRPHRPN
jgi:hypothetical protein